MDLSMNTKPDLSLGGNVAISHLGPFSDIVIF